ncbi:MAG: MlaD family protein [Planctomycetota bacterium]|jgi:phospholipid/cholesterol/gamma-HCH transport system substrate-binding protein/paraquat-inducible protein B
MSAKANYFKIGLFVITGVVLVLVAIVIFGSGVLAEEKMYFETYFDGSVSGLDVGAPVEYRGVRMGRVEKVTFAVNEYELPVGSEQFFKSRRLIMVVASVDTENLPAKTPQQRKANLAQMVAEGLRLRLASNILTGLAFLQADYLDPKRFPVLEVPWEPENLYIPTAPGELSTLKQSVDKILSKLQNIDTERIGRLIEEILASLVQAVDDANLPEVSRGVQNLIASANRAVEDANVSAVSSELKGLFAEARETNQHLKRLLASDKLRPQSPNIAEVITQLSKTLRRIDKLVSTQTPQIEQALEDLRKVSANLEELTENLKKHPAELIFSQPPPRSEVQNER